MFCCGGKKEVDVEDADKVLCAKRGPIPIKVEAGQTYYFCTCGRSKKQPFCDGSHAGTKFTPTPFTATATEDKYFCGCKQSASQPFCDGKHKKLPENAEGKLFVPGTVK